MDGRSGGNVITRDDPSRDPYLPRDNALSKTEVEVIAEGGKGRVVPHGTGGKPQKCLVAPFFNSLPLFLRSKAVDLFIGERNHLRVVASVH